tara:strand:- start:4267 stop:4689 length:423 start_codon:yes stop_codon:yes gene_type:complete
MYEIKCLECHETNTYNHLEWSAAVCQHCKQETYNPHYNQPSIYAALAGIDRTRRDHGNKGYHTPSISLSTGEKISLAEWRESLLFIHSLIQRYTIHMQKNQYDYADQLEEYIADQCLLYFVDIDKSIHEHYEITVEVMTS